MPPSKAELERYRDPDEGLDQWTVKRAFLEKNWDAFPEERRQKLVTLMHCFHNMHVWGCSYPAKVMAEVRTLSEGLVTNKPKAAKKPQFVRINFVAATPVANQFSALDEELDSEVLLEDEAQAATELNELSREKRTRKKKNNKKKATAKPPETEAVEVADEVDELDFPTCGLGFKSSTTNSISQIKITSNFVFGKKEDYTKRLGFVRSSEVNEGFQFGKPIPLSQKSSLDSGLFQFGVDNKSTSHAATEVFTFGDVRRERMRSSDDLQRRFENASLQETSCKPKQKVPESKTPNTTDHSRILVSLEAVRSKLKKVRPPLAQSRIEFAILQVSLATQGEVKTVRKGGEVSLCYKGVLVATGPSEPEAYEDFRNKILSPDPLIVSMRASGPVLEISKEMVSPAKRRPSDVSLDAVPGVRPAQNPPLTGDLGNHATAPGTSYRDVLPSSSASSRSPLEVPKSTNGIDLNLGNAQSRPLTFDAQSKVSRNLETVRKTMCTSNFKTKIEMLGGFDKDPISALNMAFQMAALKPVKEAEVPGPACRFRLSSSGSQQKCTVKVHGVSVSEASAKSNREAKKLAALSLLNMLRASEGFRIVFRNGENQLVTSSGMNLQTPLTNAQRSPAPVVTTDITGVEGLFLIRMPNDEQDLTSILNRSAHANDFAPPVYTYAVEGNEHRCHLTLSGKLTLDFEGRATSKAVSRDEAVRVALNTLIASCPTVLVGSIANDAKEFVRDATPLGVASPSVTAGLNRQISRDNVGFQLLERMGWTGGGLGGGGGLIEPIMLKDNSGSRGLGYTKSEEPGKRFLANIHGTLRAFLRESDVFQELKFSPTFSNVERMHIHTIAKRLGLKSKSSNRPEGRVLCVSHNIDWKMILSSLMQQGDTLGKFKLLPPGSWSLPEKTRRGP